ncbi:multidrug transporter [Sedimentibacter sp.]|uniref:multidrug transporter n=2 Tax=Bacillota TaxID=1239 RepID=UPI00289894B8|nr:multidrug transporter [Sedimentibacter sp.]
MQIKVKKEPFVAYSEVVHNFIDDVYTFEEKYINRGRFEVMQEQRFTKRDWTLFKNKIADWQESYMDRLNKEYIELLSEDTNPSEKFWRLDKRIKEDRKKTGVQLEMSRSNLINNIISLINDGAISFENLEEFSDELKETVNVFIDR